MIIFTKKFGTFDPLIPIVWAKVPKKTFFSGHLPLYMQIKWICRQLLLDLLSSITGINMYYYYLLLNHLFWGTLYNIRSTFFLQLKAVKKVLTIFPLRAKDYMQVTGHLEATWKAWQKWDSSLKCETFLRFNPHGISTSRDGWKHKQHSVSGFQCFNMSCRKAQNLCIRH